MNPTHFSRCFCTLFSVLSMCTIFQFYVTPSGIPLREARCIYPNVCCSLIQFSPIHVVYHKRDGLSSACPFVKLDCALISLESVQFNAFVDCCQRFKYTYFAFLFTIFGMHFQFNLSKMQDISHRIIRAHTFYALENNV